MPRFPEITTQDLRRLDTAAVDLSGLSDMEAVERTFVHMAGDLLPGSCICWNHWTLDMNSQLSSSTNSEYSAGLAALMEPLNTVVRHHPLIAAGAWRHAFVRPQRMSDFQGMGSFRHNPLFHEVYRHLDSHYQLVRNIVTHGDQYVCLTWNRHRTDFTERDRTLLQLIGRRLDVILRRLAERERLEHACASLRSGFAASADLHQRAILSNVEGRLLAGLLRGRSRAEIATRLGWRRDTLDRRLRVLRERLGFENTAVLLRALSQNKR